jgi:hypothetical protein
MSELTTNPSASMLSISASRADEKSLLTTAIARTSSAATAFGIWQKMRAASTQQAIEKKAGAPQDARNRLDEDIWFWREISLMTIRRK